MQEIRTLIVGKKRYPGIRLRYRLLQYLPGVVLLAVGCNTNQEFDSRKWQQKGVDWWAGDVREKMVDDLIASDTLMGMNQQEVAQLLGEPKSAGDSLWVYLIREKYGRDIDPLYISHLKIAFDRNGQANHCSIEK